MTPFSGGLFRGGRKLVAFGTRSVILWARMAAFSCWERGKDLIPSSARRCGMAGARAGAWALAAVVSIGTLAAPPSGAAEPPAAPDASFVVKTWRTTDGLPQSTVTALA